jgi:hypothetical protein
MNERRWEKTLEASEQAYVLLQWETGNFEATSTLPKQLEMLRPIVKSNCNNMSRRRIVYASRVQAIRWWQEMPMPHPPKSCGFCWWPGENKCGRCQIVYYCSKECRPFDHKEHKSSCIAPTDVKKDYPKPKFQFQKHRSVKGECSMIIPAASNYHTGTVERALLTGENVNTLRNNCRYPVQYTAMRREPENAVEIMRALIEHGAGSNIIDVDRKHLVAIYLSRTGQVDR